MSKDSLLSPETAVLQLTRGSDGGRLGVGDFAGAATASLDGPDDLHGLLIGNLSEDDVLAIEPTSYGRGDEELRTITEATRLASTFQGAKEARPYVFGPALAMERRPGVVCFALKFSSANFSP